jgi:DNA-binding protein Fis
MDIQGTKESLPEMKEDATPYSVVERVLEKRLEDVVTMLSSDGKDKSRIYEDILCMVEGILIRIAMRRSNYIKSAAATFLGINRNTLHSKIEKMGIPIDK